MNAHDIDYYLHNYNITKRNDINAWNFLGIYTPYSLLIEMTSSYDLPNWYYYDLPNWYYPEYLEKYNLAKQFDFLSKMYNK